MFTREAIRANLAMAMTPTHTRKELKPMIMMKTFKTEDGYTFYVADDGRVTDSPLNPDREDMSWPN